ncbi:hypothetical protein SAMN02745857_03463 [Andreprevotia lacus DSM 23236]|jgi:hypothetical protein|uniref:FecR family protein n=1 Tax=Andreprevotia lacus DSM 23236 TaxID=1121001 RepID=A0A1W1XY47_9NEIS|nr:hypothetical protein [Andreprevotia lacus]SMC28889.1 hypothetical protein SAMN02745857_03463 [Andreprevotia lacus DSM 23236]
MKRRTLLAAAAASPLFWALQALGAPAIVQGIRSLKGSVSINGKPARQGDLVHDGDVVETGPDSQVSYVVGKDAFLQRENSRVEIGGNAAKRVLRLATGALLGVFGKGDITLHTSTATIGIRGTGCYLESEAGRSYVCLCYGKAELTPTAAPDKAIRYQTHHHDSPYWVNDDGDVLIPAKTINHTDAELTLIEALVGRKPPFRKSYGDYEYSAYGHEHD